MPSTSDGHFVPAAQILTPATAKNRFTPIIEVARQIEKSRLGRERELLETKWFDYRFLSPVAATQAFAVDYEKVYKLKWRETFDLHEAGQKRALMKGGLFSNSRELNSIWRTRQIADGLGVPYSFYIDHAMDACLRRGKWKRLPRPNQLGADYIQEAVGAKWQEWLGARFTMSELPQYRTELFHGLPAQLAHQDWVIARLKACHAPPFMVGRCCFITRVLPEKRAVAEFGVERVERGREEARSETPVAVVEIATEDLWQSCFGVPHAVEAQNQQCVGCPQLSQCESLDHRMRSVMVRRYGTDDPVLTHRRKQVAERVKRCRANKVPQRKRIAGGGQLER